MLLLSIFLNLAVAILILFLSYNSPASQRKKYYWLLAMLLLNLLIMVYVFNQRANTETRHLLGG
ncbi:hypothetical protein GCM10028803_22270 [Larkinella knui]|uniref:Uncharacterized protein n=1 Tax=Larkinella knui TaxID=2025310 RepID=A0A3P1CVI1_9BACT|nr:hypothetical protein [Larkinella knui]RRB17301.1 hypothetical protein EHT87_03185 [Larkinella knui]